MTLPMAALKPAEANAATPSQALGQILLSRGLITQDQLRIAEKEEGKRPLEFGDLLVALGFITEATLRQALSEKFGTKSLDLAQMVPSPAALALLPRDFALRHRVLPIDYDTVEERLLVAAAHLDDLIGMDALHNLLPRSTTVETALASESEISQAIDRYYGYELSIDGILREIETGEIDRPSLTAFDDAYSHPVIRLIDAILTDAVKHGASDIHFEPEAAFLRIRYRVDGLLRQVRALHRSYWPTMAVRIKVLAGMNIAETRAPQDGRIALTVSGRPIDFRAASQPTLHGENLVLRILDRQRGLLPIERLGLTEIQLEKLKRMVARPEGIILVTGPTGSGKTTTLYSLLNHINHEGIHIMTLEDPVEYPMPLIRQTSVAEATRLDFANGIRSMMRQDPDVILVGEIRDAETATMAFRAAMTGHQVYSTLHTNSAIGAIPRLRDIGVTPEIMAGNLIGIVAQRLVRRLCPHCRTGQPAAPEERRILETAIGDARPELFKAAGCEQCDFQGYRGRLAIMEVLRMDSAMDELIGRQATTHEIRKHAIREGFTTLAEDGIRRVLEGETSLAELARVIDLTDRY